jgi:hypothetical protein
VSRGEGARRPTLRGEEGAVFIIGALVLFTLVGVSALVIDLGWFYINGLRAQKAAEAAALAGVVHMPRDGTVAFASSEAYTVALDVAEANGFDDDAADVVVLPQEFPGEPTRRNQLRVNVTVTVPTFFGKVFGVESQTLTRHATAEQLPPLRLGSDNPNFGGPGTNLWLAINGEYSSKSNGDAYSTRCTNPLASPASPTGVGCDNGNVGPNASDLFRDPAYYYAVEVDPADAGNSLSIAVYDAAYNGNFVGPDFTYYIGSGGPLDTTFTVYEPDDSPGNPLDNSVQPPGCSPQTFGDEGPGGPHIGVPTTVCTVGAAKSGIYVLEVKVNGGNGANSFAVQTSTGGPEDAAVYGLGAMSLLTNQPGVSATFDLVQVGEIYRGRDLIISFYDAGDVRDVSGTAPAGWQAVLAIAGDGAGVACEIRTRLENDDPPYPAFVPKSGPCSIITSEDSHERIYDNRWIDIKFSIPSDYSCASDCWWQVDYTFPAGVSNTDRTTWSASVGGQPIRLIRDP